MHSHFYFLVGQSLKHFCPLPLSPVTDIICSSVNVCYRWEAGFSTPLPLFPLRWAALEVSDSCLSFSLHRNRVGHILSLLNKDSWTVLDSYSIYRLFLLFHSFISPQGEAASFAIFRFVLAQVRLENSMWRRPSGHWTAGPQWRHCDNNIKCDVSQSHPECRA